MQSNTREQIAILQEKLEAEASLIRLKTLAAWMFAERGSSKASYSAMCAVGRYCAVIFVDIVDQAPSVGDVLDVLEFSFNKMFYNEVPNNGFDVGWYNSGARGQGGAKYTVLVFPVGKAPNQQQPADKTPERETVDVLTGD
jgi:hypothetical protein